MTDLRPFDPVGGPAREEVDPEEFESAPAGSIAPDTRRRRPSFFDGRFLTARDLTREQQYALIRQADLGQISGGGVIYGLAVSIGQGSRALRVGAGLGITPTGETVVLRQGTSVNVATLPLAERLGNDLGLDFEGDSRVGSRSGLFALALRSVEYVDLPSLAFPTSINGKAGVEPAQVSEATMLAMVPLDDTRAPGAPQPSRSALASEIFLRGGLAKLAGEALPLAVVALDRGAVVWIDASLVRRRAGADSPIGFGLMDVATREAHSQQFAQQLKDILDGRAERGLDRRVVASDYFVTLPAFGWLPREAVEVLGSELVQWFFPPEFKVELSIVPADEIPRLLDEGQRLAPFDLSLSSEALEANPVSILIPVRRAEFAERLAELGGRAPAPASQLARPSAHVRPIEALDALRRHRFRPPEAVNVAVDRAPWERALSAAPILYYIRRRQFSPVSFIVPRFEPVVLAGPNPLDELGSTVRDRLLAAGELGSGVGRLEILLRRAPPASRSAVVLALRGLLELPVFDPAASIAGRMLINGAVAELAERVRARFEDVERARAGKSRVRVRALRSEDVERVRARFSASDLGQGWVALIGAQAGLNQLELRLAVARTSRVPELDAIARGLGSNTSAFAQALRERAERSDAAGIDALVASPLSFQPPSGALAMLTTVTPPQRARPTSGALVVRPRQGER